MLLQILAQEGGMQEPLFELDSTIVTMLSGVVIPILVGIIFKLRAPSAVKALGHLFLSIVAGLLNTAIFLDGVAIISRESAVNAALSYVMGVAAYYGLLQHTVSPTINRNTAEFGIGPADPNRT